MKLTDLYLRPNPLIEGFISLLTITEAFQPPWWPQEWADEVIASPGFRGWLDSLDLRGEIGRPMTGAVGRAYPVGDSHIVKFTTDKNEANAAAVMKGHESEHAAHVYDVKLVKRLPDRGGKPAHLYAIALERLNTGVGKRFRAAGNAVYSYLDDFSGFIEDPEAAIKIVVDKYLDPKSKRDPQMPAVVAKLVNALYDVQQKTGVLSQDPHGGNIALKGRKPAVFDFGRSSSDPGHPKAAGARITALR